MQFSLDDVLYCVGKVGCLCVSCFDAEIIYLFCYVCLHEGHQQAECDGHPELLAPWGPSTGRMGLASRVVCLHEGHQQAEFWTIFNYHVIIYQYKESLRYQQAECDGRPELLALWGPSKAECDGHPELLAQMDALQSE